jgi:chromate transporter
VAFVGFVGGWSGQWLGADHAAAAGIVAACVATWFTFVPSFVFILAGGPLIESTHGQLGLSAPLTAITAAVVGVIVNLAVFFATHVFWPAGVGAALQGIAAVDWIAVTIAALAMIALFRFKAGVIPVIAVSACAGLLLRLAMP